MKRTFHKDVLFSTLFTFIAIYLFKFILINTHFLNPINNALKDFEILDLAYTEFNHLKSNEADTHIVIINIADLDRKGITHLINTVNKFEPKVVGLDVTFDELKDPLTDSLLALALKNTRNLVKASAFEYEDEHSHVYSHMKTSHPKFNRYGENAFVNFVAAEKENTIRYYIPYELYHGKKITFFSNALAYRYLDNKYGEVTPKKDPDPKMIYYKGNRDKYIVFEPTDIYDSNENLKMIKNKLVLFGFMGINKDKLVFEDIHFSPLNHKYSGRSFPDMYGIMIHANIISMLIENNKIKEFPSWLTFLLAFIICYIHMYYFIRYYIHKHLWFHLFFKVIQLTTSILLVGISLFLFIRYNLKIDTAVILVPIVLSVDILYFYDALVKALHNRFGYKTVFINH